LIFSASGFPRCGLKKTAQALRAEMKDIGPKKACPIGVGNIKSFYDPTELIAKSIRKKSYHTIFEAIILVYSGG